MTLTTATPPRIYVSFTSAYCWLAVHRLRDVAPQIMKRVELVPCWNEAPISAAKRKYLDSDCQRIAQSMGLMMATPSTPSGSWELTQLAWLYVSTLGKGDAMWEALMTSRFLRGEDITVPERIRRLARAVGVDGDVLDAVHAPSLRALAQRLTDEACDDDAFAVPYFRAGRHRFFGFDRVDDFARMLAPSAQIARLQILPAVEMPAEQPVVHVYDTDAAGGCG